jgi:hypothetical protein
MIRRVLKCILAPTLLHYRWILRAQRIEFPEFLFLVQALVIRYAKSRKPEGRSTMKNSTRFFVGSCLLILLACYGCGAENSELEMKQAQQAMDQAKSVYAEDITPADWKEAVQIWEQAQTAVKDGKPAKVLFVRAKNRFEKLSTIAKSRNEAYSKDLDEMQQTINTRFEKVKKALEGGKLSGKAQGQVKTLASEIEEGKASIKTLVDQGNYLKAAMKARDLQTKIYNAELIMAGQKPI